MRKFRVELFKEDINGIFNRDMFVELVAFLVFMWIMFGWISGFFIIPVFYLWCLTILGCIIWYFYERWFI